MNRRGAGPGDSGGLAAALKAAVRGSALYAPVRRERLRRLTATPGAYPDWSRLLSADRSAWDGERAAADGPRVLLATNLGLHFTANTIDSLLAVALTRRRAQVEFLLCDGALPACQVVDHTLAPSVARYAAKGPQPDFCRVCQDAGERNFAPLGLPVRRLSSLITAEDRRAAFAAAETLASEALNPTATSGAPEHGYAGALRFFGRSLLPDEPAARAVLQRYLAAAMLARAGADALLRERKYDVVVAHHGIYAPQGGIADAARAAGARLVTWHASYRKGRLIYEHGDTYHRAMIDEPTERWATRALTASEDAALDRYLDSRMTGAQDWITFQRSGPQDDAELVSALGFSFDKPTMILIGNVAWDARLHYKSSAYGDMTAWAADTARWFAARPDRQLIVRCHPGEVMSSPRAVDRLDDAVRRALPSLPPNIAIVPPESALNTYALAARSQAALIYNTKMGVELAARGMPVIVAGDAWIRGKGVAQEAESPAAYAALLERAHLLETLPADRRALARRYAFHFFFRRCLPVDAFDLARGWPLCTLREDAYSRAAPGVDEGLDVICRGVLDGARFEYDGPLNHA